jgi:hypothetical protein
MYPGWRNVSATSAMLALNISNWAPQQERESVAVMVNLGSRRAASHNARR